MASMYYFGVIEDIWVIDYTSFKVPVFKGEWVDCSYGVGIDDMGFTLVDLENFIYIEEPFIMESQVKQVFYVTDPINKKWSVVMQGRATQIVLLRMMIQHLISVRLHLSSQICQL